MDCVVIESKKRVVQVQNHERPELPAMKTCAGHDGSH